MSSTPEVPAPTRIRNRLFFDRHDVESYKRRLLGLPILERDPHAVIELVPAAQFASEMGRCRRTLGRRLGEIKSASAEADASAAA
jgi:hypothetical protein